MRRTDAVPSVGRVAWSSSALVRSTVDATARRVERTPCSHWHETQAPSSMAAVVTTSRGEAWWCMNGAAALNQVQNSSTASATYRSRSWLPCLMVLDGRGEPGCPMVPITSLAMGSSPCAPAALARRSDPGPSVTASDRHPRRRRRTQGRAWPPRRVPSHTRTGATRRQPGVPRTDNTKGPALWGTYLPRRLFSNRASSATLSGCLAARLSRSPRSRCRS